MILAVLLVVLAAAPAAAGPLDHPGYSKALTCSACHGFAGNSKSEAMPIIAGMTAGYLKKALQDYASGKRPSPEMEPYSKMAVHLGADDVAGYFAAQKREATPIKVDAAAAERGKAAATACAACHGADGKGDPAKLVPSLAGQRSPGDEALKQMKTLMRSIPDQAVSDLAAYYSSLR